MIFETINASPIDTRWKLYESILITGGSTMFPGFPTRLSQELKNLYVWELGKGRKFEECGIDINIIDPFSRKHAVFIGGSILSEVYDK